MAYAPGITDRSGEFLAQGINKAGENIAGAIEAVAQRKEESQAADMVMDFIARTNPEALPKGEGGTPDAKFLEKFFAGNLKTKQQTLGMIATKLMTPTQEAQAKYYNALAAGAGTKGAPAAQAVDNGDDLRGWIGGDPLPAADPMQAPAPPEFIGPPLPPAPPLGLPPLAAPPMAMSSANRAAVFRPPPMGFR